MNVGHWRKANPKASGLLLAPRSGHTMTIMVFYLLIYPSKTTQIANKILITSPIAHLIPRHKIAP